MAELTKQQRAAATSARAARTNTLDKESHAMILDGCNQTQLCKIFAIDRRNLEDKIRDVAPSGTRGGYPIFRIKDVAPHVVKPIYDVETYIRKMNHKDLPPALSREYWTGLRAKQEYELREKELWHTTDVIIKVGELMQALKMSWMLTRDSIERDTVLTPEQRERMIELMDDALNRAADQIKEQFTPREDDDDSSELQDEEL